MAASAIKTSKKKSGSSSSFAAELLPHSKEWNGGNNGDNGSSNSKEKADNNNNSLHQRERESRSNGEKPQRAKKEDKPMSKRQRQKLVNNKHKWPQQPRISSPEARAKAYVRVSGLTHTPKEELDAQLDLHSPSVRFGRLLGSPDQRTRHQAVLQLETYLKARCDITTEAGLSEMDLLKLWKGLWHTLYMADKVPVQEELSEHLANLIWCVAGTQEEDEFAGQAYLRLYEDDNGDDNDKEEELDDSYDEDDGDDGDNGEKDGDNDDESENDDEMDDDEDNEDAEDEGNVNEITVNANMEEDSDSMSNSDVPHCRGAHLASLFVRTFLRTVRREWGRMDKYRVDKFYSLMRKVIHQVYRYMALRHWNLGIIRLFNDSLYEEILSQTPNGLRYHLIDITMDELALVHSEAPMRLTEATFIDCLEPYFAMAQTGAGDDTVQSRVLENILTKFLIQYSVISEVAEGDDEEAKLLLLDNVHVGTIANFIFEVASDPDTRDAYRKSLYDTHKQYARRLKLVGRDVDLDASMEEDDVEEEMENNHEEEHEPAAEDENEIRYDGDVDTPEAPSRKRKLVENATDDRDQENGNEELEVKRKKKHKKKKKKRSASEDSTDSVESDKSETKKPLVEEDEKGEEEFPPSNEKEDEKKTKKKKKKRSSKDITQGEGPASAAEIEQDNGVKPKKKKKRKTGEEDPCDYPGNDKERDSKKKKKKDMKARKENDESQQEEQEIVITTKTQKKAKSAMNENKKAAREERRKDSATTKSDDKAESKRVKFGSTNVARSWKASMKALRAANPATPPVTPDKSILLNKGGSAKKVENSRTKRKKAVDYF